MPRNPDCKWAFANPETGKPYTFIFYPWNNARKSVGLSDVRMHDLRHSFAHVSKATHVNLHAIFRSHTDIKLKQAWLLTQSLLQWIARFFGCHDQDWFDGYKPVNQVLQAYLYLL